MILTLDCFRGFCDAQLESQLLGRSRVLHMQLLYAESSGAIRIDVRCSPELSCLIFH